MKQPYSKSMRDVRTLHSLVGSTPPADDDVFLRLHRLAAEKHRLEREAEVWQRKKEQIEMRLGEIAQQMEHLRQSASTAGKASPRQAWRQVTLEY